MSSGEVERPALEGRVFTDGVAQETTREDGVTRIRLTCMPGHPAGHAATHGGPMEIRLPEAVRVGAGEWVSIEVEGLPGVGEDAVYVRDPSTFTSAHLFTSGAPVPPDAARGIA